MATKVIINPGACGFPAVVVIKKKDGETFSVSITSECEMVSKLGAEIGELTMMDVFKRIPDNPVFRKGAICLRHVACPALSGILKALEVEAGLNLPKDVSITFVAEDAEDK